MVAAGRHAHSSLLILRDLVMELKLVRNLRTQFGVAAKVKGDSARMAKSEQYRRFAWECMEMAGMFVSERARAALVHMAQVWLRLADEKEVEHEEADREG